jgi:predicted component of type VI protein secretion system
MKRKNLVILLWAGVALLVVGMAVLGLRRDAAGDAAQGQEPEEATQAEVTGKKQAVSPIGKASGPAPPLPLEQVEYLAEPPWQQAEVVPGDAAEDPVPKFAEAPEDPSETPEVIPENEVAVPPNLEEGVDYSVPPWIRDPPPELPKEFLDPGDSADSGGQGE